MSHLMPNYSPLDVAFVKGDGCYLTDTNGEQYLDALSGVGVVSLGHCHKDITKAIQSQAAELVHTSNWYHIKNQEELAKKICTLSGMDNAFFGNSGAEANEAAIKIARLYGESNNITEPTIITAKNSFHGRTMATLSATGNPKVQSGFAPLVSKFIHVDFNNIDEINNHSKNTDIVAVMLEPIQGESGVIIPQVDYLNEVRKICDKNNWLLILDEVQTGIGRTGKLFAHQHNNITPDILTLAKGLGNGVPIGACLAKGKASRLLVPGTHGSTFGGNPLVCKTALTVLEVIERDGILDNVSEMGNFLSSQFKEKLRNSKKVHEIRSKGLMIAIELKQDCAVLLQRALENKLLINITGKTIRLLPPLVINKDEAGILVSKVCSLVEEL
ncbi:MAG TPA: aspartate aminotransferase family protein [Candidatus Thioglobus sp.]|nr:aspartate aminotransferase family protein [Candidatus Thioglobus sp.]HIL42688.1 aspartate aminotransferase family protein [Gammaproteobacteria bacterium]